MLPHCLTIVTLACAELDPSRYGPAPIPVDATGARFDSILSVSVGAQEPAVVGATLASCSGNAVTESKVLPPEHVPGALALVSPSRDETGECLRAQRAIAAVVAGRSA